MTRSVTALLMTLGSLGVGVAAATPASAESACYTNEKTFTPLYHPVIVDIATCIKVTGDKKQAYANVDWFGRGSMGSRFDSFKVTIRLEFLDHTYLSATCDYTYELDDQYDGSRVCKTDVFTSSSTGNWTGDGVVHYNLDNDGKGELDPWQLHGSPKA